MRDHVVESLFSLFTSPDRAASMAGDLVEERERRGWIWFWLHAVRITCALCRNDVAAAPLRVLALTLAGAALLFVPVVAGAAAVGVFPQLLGSAVSWMTLSAFWWGGALWTGASLVAIASRRGMAACAILAVAGAVLLLALGIAIGSQGFTALDRMFFAIALGITIALPVGGAIARRRTLGLAASVVFVLAAASPSAAQQSEWRDPSSHAVTFVSVDADVRLEVLDWGGSGPALVLLAGLGDTAHVFDDFAPMLTARYRVVGVTRRAHGRSSAPLGGYGFARLAEDVARVIDGIGLDKPVVLGHSFAGEEMHVLGARHAAKIAGLIYVDAAFDRGDDSDDAAYDAVARTLPPAPARGPGDMASFAALRAFLQKMQGFAGPEAHLRARWVANPDGGVARLWAPDLPIRQAMTKEMQAAYKPYKPEPIRVPAVAIYAAPKSPADLMRPWYAADDPAVRERVEKLYGLERARVEHHIQWFETFAERRRVVEVAGAHHLFLSNPSEVLREIDRFMAARP